MSDVQTVVGKLKDFEAKIVTKSLEDDEFRKKLLDDPKGAIAAEAGKTLPESLVVKVREEEPNTLTIILPQKAMGATAEGELSDDALEKVAGGAILNIIGKLVVDAIF